MPIYSYECNKCGHEVEEFRRIADAMRLDTCEKCGSTMQKVQKSFSVSTWPPASAGSARRGHGGVHLEHMGPNGKIFYSKKELRDHCKKNGLHSGAL